MKKIIHMTAVFALTGLSAIAQTYDILGIKSINYNAMQPLTENQEIKGYYSIVALDKAGKNQRNYNLGILDNNLKRLYSIDMVKSDRLSLLESSYNGDAFCFSYYNSKDRVLEYDVYDKTGKSAGQYSLEISKSEAALYQQMLQKDDDTFQGTLVGVKGKGFIRYGYEKEDGYRISIEMIDNTGKKKWTTDSKATSKKSYEGIAPLYTDDRVAIAMLSTREKMLTAKGTQYSVIFINTDNGQEYFRLSSDGGTNKYQLSALGASYNQQSQTYFVYGQFFGAEDNPVKDDSQGFYMQEVDLNGKVLSESFTKWEDQIESAIARKAKGDIKKNMKMYIHTVVRTADGKIFAIAEQYRKAVSGLGVATKLMNGGGGASAMKIETHDIVCLEFDSKLKFKDATIYDKNKTNIQLPDGWGAIDANKLGTMLANYGYFDYAFTVTSSDKKTFTSCYVDYDKDKEAGSNYSIGNIGYTKDQKLVYDQIKLITKPTGFRVYKAKPGYIAILEYYKKDKKATLRLEKLNFS